MAEYVHPCPTQRKQAQVKTVAREKTIYIYSIQETLGGVDVRIRPVSTLEKSKCIDSELRNWYFGPWLGLSVVILYTCLQIRNASNKYKNQIRCIMQSQHISYISYMHTENYYCKS